MAVKQANEVDFTVFILPRFVSLIPPRGTNSSTFLREIKLNFCTLNNPF